MSKPLSRLTTPLFQHLHIPDPRSAYHPFLSGAAATRRSPHFHDVSTFQNTLVQAHLAHKALLSSNPPPRSPPPAPKSLVLSFSPTPVYTLGRREANTLNLEQLRRLRELRNFIDENGEAQSVCAAIVQTTRGGQITFHGPGQLLIYPIMDIKAVSSERFPRGMTARCFVNVLEEATIRTLKLYGVEGMRTENPGVWVNEQRKIAALGVHMRRNISSFGVGINLATDLAWFERIVACGLEGKEMTSLAAELPGKEIPPPKQVGRVWAEEFIGCVWGENVYREMVVEDIMEDKTFREIEERARLERLNRGPNDGDDLSYPIDVSGNPFEY